MRKELFEFRHIVKHIGGHAALRDVSLRLYQDEIPFWWDGAAEDRSYPR